MNVQWSVIRLNCKRKKLIALAVAAIAVASAAGIAVTQFAEHPLLTVSPANALAGNPVRISLDIPLQTHLTSFKLYSIDYGDGNTTHAIHSSHIYGEPGTYHATASFEWNGHMEESTTEVRVHPSSFTAKRLNLGDTASYGVTGTLDAYNPFGIITVPFNASGISTTLSVDSVFMTLRGNSSFSVGNSTVTIPDALGVPQKTYVLSTNSSITGKGYVEGTAAGLPVNLTAVVVMGYAARTFDSVNGNYTVMQEANTSTSVSLQIGGGIVSVGGTGVLSTHAYANLTGGMPWQNSMISAIGDNGSFAMTAAQLSKYAGGFSGNVQMALRGLYHGVRWSADQFNPSLSDPALEINITSGSSFTGHIKLDSLSAFPLFANTSSISSDNGTTISYSTDSARVVCRSGAISAASGGSYGKDNAVGRYILWNGSALPAIGTAGNILNITAAYNFALNNTSLGSYISKANGAEMVSAQYNFSRSSWSMQFGDPAAGGYEVTVVSLNGTLNASGQSASVNLSGGTASGLNVLTLASALQIVNSSSVSSQFFGSGSVAEISSISISAAPYLPMTSPFLPLPTSSSAFAYTFTSMTGYTVTVDGTNGQIMYYESGTSFPFF